jgi:broad specificity phosphatase PhoE
MTNSCGEFLLDTLNIEVSQPVAPDLSSVQDLVGGSFGNARQYRQQCTLNEYKNLIVSQNLAQGALAVIFIRHGRSVANERDAMHSQGQGQVLRDAPNHEVPLVACGIEQSRAAGRYLAKLVVDGVIPSVDRVMYSPFQRTQETLNHLIEGSRQYCQEQALPIDTIFADGDQTKVEQWLGVREREWADFEDLDAEEQEKQYARRKAEPYSWQPGCDYSGESLSSVSNRASGFMQAMHRPEFWGKVVVVVTHGEFMNAVELVTRRMDPFADEFEDAFRRGIPNCGMMMFSRVEFAPTMPTPQEMLGGFSKQLRVVPYALQRPTDEAKFSEWLEPTWSELTKPTRSSLGSFSPRPRSDTSNQLATIATENSIGGGEVTPRV